VRVGTIAGGLHEILLNRLVHPLVPFNMGFRVLEVRPDVDLVHIHTHPSVLKRIGSQAGRCFQRRIESLPLCALFTRSWSERRIEGRLCAGARDALTGASAVLDPMLNHEPITLAYTFSRWGAVAEYLARGVPDWKIRVGLSGLRHSRNRQAGRHRPLLPSCFLGRQASAKRGGTTFLTAFPNVCAAERCDVRLRLRDGRVFPRRRSKGVRVSSSRAGNPRSAGSTKRAERLR